MQWRSESLDRLENRWGKLRVKEGKALEKCESRRMEYDKRQEVYVKAQQKYKEVAGQYQSEVEKCRNLDERAEKLRERSREIDKEMGFWAANFRTNEEQVKVVDEYFETRKEVKESKRLIKLYWLKVQEAKTEREEAARKAQWGKESYEGEMKWAFEGVCKDKIDLGTEIEVAMERLEGFPTLKMLLERLNTKYFEAVGSEIWGHGFYQKYDGYLYNTCSIDDVRDSFFHALQLTYPDNIYCELNEEELKQIKGAFDAKSKMPKQETKQTKSKKKKKSFEENLKEGFRHALGDIETRYIEQEQAGKIANQFITQKKAEWERQSIPHEEIERRLIEFEQDAQDIVREELKKRRRS